jgi:hypothetical protein
MNELLSDEFAHKLRLLAEQHAAEYRENKPFPYIFFDNFLPVEVAEAALREYPEPKQMPWKEFNNPLERKLAFDIVEKLPPADRSLLYFLNSRPMLQFLEILTGINGLIPDPYFEGGGLHQIVPGGKLAVHADFNRHPKLNLDRRINVLIYLNKDWKEEYGGHFELWDKQMTRAERTILPIFNRCAIFSTTSSSFHGHPTPLACPPERTRKSVATYYYTNGRPEQEVEAAHSTLFKPLSADLQRPNVSGAATASAAYASDVLRRDSFTWRKLAWAITPPLLHEFYKKCRGL